jgi:RimJ/RimL family protein N-acetyltransferase
LENKKVLIKGKNIQLRTTIKSDMELKVKWYGDPEVNKTLVLPEKLELDKTYQWFEKTKNDSSRFDITIETLDGVPIGVIGLKNINKNNRSALLYIVIGEKDYWGKGLGLEAELLAIHYGFKEMGLHRVLATALENNPASIRVCEKVGFVLEGTSRDDYYRDGKFYNVNKYSILRNEFYEKHPEFENSQ